MSDTTSRRSLDPRTWFSQNGKLMADVKKDRPRAGERLIEPLEGRIAPAVLYVDNSFSLSADADANNSVSNGDTVAWTSSSEGSVAGLTVGTDAFLTISAAISAATSGDTIRIADGTFNENLLIDKKLTLDGAGSGAGAGATIIDGSVGGIASSGIWITGSGDSATDRLLVKDLHVQGSQTDAVKLSTTVSFVTLENVSAAGGENSTGGYKRGVWVPGGTEVNDLVLDGITMEGFFNGGVYFDAGVDVDGFQLVNSTLKYNRLAFHNNANSASAANGDTFKNVVIADNQILNNDWKGIYIEQISNASIVRNLIKDTGLGGPSPAVMFSNGNGNSGLELNVKYGSHSNINIQDNVFDNSGAHTGAGVYVGGALAIKARSDAPTYSGNPGSLSDVTVSGNEFKNTPASGRAIVIGETGKNAPTPLNLTITGNSLSDGTARAVVNTTVGTVNASGNWFGSADAAAVLSLTQGSVDVSPFLNSGADTSAAVGFQPSYANLSVTAQGPQSGSVGRIQEGVNLAAAGATIQVNAGTYTEHVLVNKTVSLVGAQAGIDARSGRTAAAETVVNGPGGSFSLQANGIVLDGFTVTGTTLGQPIGAGIYTSPSASGYEIRNNIIQDNIIGLYLNANGGSQTVLQYNLIRDNDNVGAAGGTGVYSDQGLSNVLIESNKIAGANETAGINLASATSTTGVVITGNQFTDGNQLVLFNIDGGTISGNQFSGTFQDGTSGTGIFVGGGSDNTVISGNTFTNRGSGAISVTDAGFAASTNVTISGNVINQDVSLFAAGLTSPGGRQMISVTHAGGTTNVTGNTINLTGAVGAI